MNVLSWKPWIHPELKTERNKYAISGNYLANSKFNTLIIYMAPRSLTVLLILLLVFQPVATAFAGCMQKDSTEQAGDNGHMMNGKLMTHHQTMHESPDEEKQHNCFTNCQCAGTCLHACHTASIIIFNNPIVLEKQINSYSITYYSLPGYKFLLLRPPAAVS